MPIEIKEVKNKKDLATFIYLPETIHANHTNWLPPIYLDEWKFFSATQNTMFREHDTILLLAFENNLPVGRIMGILPHHYNKLHNLKSARFAFFECYEKADVFEKLIQFIENWAKAKNCTELVGPMGFSDKEPQGFLISGYETTTMMVTNCNFPFMKRFIEQNGYLPHVDLCQYEVPLNNKLIDRFCALANRVEKNNHVHIIEFKKTNSVRRYVLPVFKLINDTYHEIYGFSPVSEREANEFSNRFLPFLDANLIKIVTNADNEVIAFIVAMPDLSPGIKKAKGRIFPLGWYHILRAGKKSKRLILLLGAISKHMRNKGLDALMAHRLLQSATKKGYSIIDSHLIMKENYKMRREIERLDDFNMYKEYRIYRKEI
jgi:hypothetical protein